ncbi:type VI secretion system tip protein TssI/VgrG [Paucibacter sp. R3-3]|uniref:Type VI secretion system tip protein TssI/VgrG n=1 Tax=Roseateles agri TaxID=3098619 RepID=A0ABU5DAK5_9BURK|nr:type VI secretion system tip protein TssI/VgrG [Paucibacter sp. R3-3]MDY0743284.1 type VI secretion system tip protein TssI/VgrG [Paucibacter sp. R3-3]
MPPSIQLSSPLPASDLLFESMSLSQGLSVLDDMQLQLLSEKPDLMPEDLLGKPLTVTVALRDGGKRHFNGLVTRFAAGRAQDRYFGYQARVRPWLWFLTRTSDCRIFQDQTVPDIVKAVFSDHGGLASFEFKLFRSYRKRVYCVQYRESDYNFVARLLEEEGIYWYVEHDEKTHKLMLVDDAGAHSPAEGCEKLPYYANARQVPPDTDYVSSWTFAREVKTGKVVLDSYDFERPSTSLRATKALARKHALAEYEQFDWQGDYTQQADGQQLTENRIDELQARHEQLGGGTNAQALAVGSKFKLERHPRADRNVEYLCVQTHISAHVDAYEAGGGSGAGSYECSFAAMPSAQQYRPPRNTPKPFVQGPQTAIVVGPAGEEIFTDKYARVKVQFHWDRYGKKDEKSSCWVRVSAPWAGKSFGFIQVPRIGQEVVVDFLEGDPDQPLITGRVYNAEQMPPWDLPANATQSGILTRSSKGGSYAKANAIRFEDKSGSEQLWLHAEKNQDIEVENDETHWVGHDRKKTIDHDETTHVKHDRTETVDNNETITIGVDRKEKVGSNETIDIGANRTETVAINETISIGGNRKISVSGSETATVTMQRTHMVGINETIGVGGAQEIGIGGAQVVVIGALQSVTVAAIQTTNVGASQSISVGASQSTTVGASQNTQVAADRGVKVGGAQSTTVAKARSAQVGEDDTLKVGKNLVIDAGESVTIKTGSASISMKKDGTITIKGKDITIDGSGKINVKASSDIVMKGPKVGIN